MKIFTAARPNFIPYVTYSQTFNYLKKNILNFKLLNFVKFYFQFFSLLSLSKSHCHFTHKGHYFLKRQFIQKIHFLPQLSHDKRNIFMIYYLKYLQGVKAGHAY